MFRFMQGFGRDSHARWRGTGPINRVRPRNHRLNCEALESRQSLSGVYIVNAASGKALTDPGGSTSNGAVIQQYQLNGQTNQQWNLLPLPDGNFEVKNASSGKVLGDPGGSTSAWSSAGLQGLLPRGNRALTRMV
jgi:endo-1,4-beta-xylanase